MTKSPKTIEELLNEIDHTTRDLEAMREEAIQKLLEQRKLIDKQLSQLGFSDNHKPQDKAKRKRRTRAEIEAAKARGED